MKACSDAQAAFLRLVKAPPHGAEAILYEPSDDGFRASLCVEQIDRENDTGRLSWLYEWRDGGRDAPRFVRVSTVEAAIREGWVSDLHESIVHLPATRWSVERTYRFRELRLEEDGEIVLGRWHERKLKAPPTPLPTLTPREREVAELALRAIELGYALAPRKPARAEARRLRRAGWFGTCWIANNALGLVPTPMTVVELRPSMADLVAPAEGGDDGR